MWPYCSSHCPYKLLNLPQSRQDGQAKRHFGCPWRQGRQAPKNQRVGPKNEKVLHNLVLPLCSRGMDAEEIAWVDDHMKFNGASSAKNGQSRQACWQTARKRNSQASRHGGIKNKAGQTSPPHAREVRASSQPETEFRRAILARLQRNLQRDHLLHSSNGRSQTSNIIAFYLCSMPGEGGRKALRNFSFAAMRPCVRAGITGPCLRIDRSSQRLLPFLLLFIKKRGMGPRFDMVVASRSG